MGKVLETRIRVGVEAQGGEQVAATIGPMAIASKSAQAAFEAAEQASESLYSGHPPTRVFGSSQWNAVAMTTRSKEDGLK